MCISSDRSEGDETPRGAACRTPSGEWSPSFLAAKLR